MAENAQKKARKPPESAARVFRAVAQCDYSAQMDVVRWLMSDPLYQVVAIIHNRDIYTPEEVAERAETGADYITRTNGDGSQSQYRAGDVKPAHVHLLLRVTAKMRASTLSKRFCGQLHFEAVADAPHCARYLLHRTYDSREKAQYNFEELRFSEVGASDCKEWYNSLYGGFGAGTCDVVGRVMAARECIQALRASGEISAERSENQALVDLIVKNGDSEALGSIMAHAYFYKEFT